MHIQVMITIKPFSPAGIPVQRFLRGFLHRLACAGIFAAMLVTGVLHRHTCARIPATTSVQVF